jgi:hypothetical protein
MRARHLLLLLVAALALVAAGCGGDDSSEASGDATETAVVETETTDDDGTMTDDGGTMTDDDDGTTTDADEDIDVGDLSGECAQFAGISSKLAQSLSGQDADLDEAARVFDEIADEVPDEIKDDYRVIADNFAKLAEALQGVDLSSGAVPDPETLAKLEELGRTLDSAEVQQASENLEAWARENC